LPSFVYTYEVGINGSANWYYPSDGHIPSTGPLQILYNVDGNASPATLTFGNYYWGVTVQDAEGNRAESGAIYIVP
jgi:hypothetical protein